LSTEWATVEIQDPILIQHIMELANDDAALVEIDAELRRVKARREVIGRKYAVMRDIVTERLGCSPYATSLVVAPNYDDIEFRSEGAFRFIYMDVGSAALAALEEAKEPMTLEELVNTL
jgi:hypothetical protein